MELYIIHVAVNSVSKVGPCCLQHRKIQNSTPVLSSIGDNRKSDKPVEDITQSISSEKASVSIIISYIRALRRSWENCSNDRYTDNEKRNVGFTELYIQ